METEFGRRMLALRRLLGTDRDPMAFGALADLIQQRTSVEVSGETLRRWELGKGDPTLVVVAALAIIDPLNRGKLWFAWGESAEETTPGVATDTGRPAESVLAEEIRQQQAEAGDPPGRSVDVRAIREPEPDAELGMRRRPA